MFSFPVFMRWIMPEIVSVDPKSPADRAGLKPGDRLKSINGHPVRDVLDYKFYAYDRDPVFELEDGRRIRLKKKEGMEPGLDFSTYLMDSQKGCANRCIFCFIDQLPKGLRPSLYFKDDDARMSFLLGNYISLTNLSDEDADRIIRMRVSPLNVSVHTTNPELRTMMLQNKRGGESLKYLKKFLEAGLTVNCQIVLCPNINDGAELESTLSDLCQWGAASVSVVPVGITRYREGLYPLTPMDRDCARRNIGIIERFRGGRTDVCASDEMFLRAELDIPPEEYYGTFSQLENGVGLMALTESEFMSALRLETPESIPGPRTIATGKAAESFIRRLVEEAVKKYPSLDCEVVGVENEFFGKTVDVAGLITGGDLIRTLKGRVKGKLIIPDVMLRHGETVFLDDVSLDTLENELGCAVTVYPADGNGLYDALFSE